MSWVMERYRRLREIRRHSAGETRQIRTGGGAAKRLYLSDWVVLSRPERKRQRKHTDHTIRWMTEEEMLAACEPYDVVSFDVFDTLLCRGCGAPEHAFLMLERENGIPDFAASRQAAERLARQEAMETRHTPEVTLAEIYRTMAQHGMIPDGRAAMEAEWRLEQKLIAPHPTMSRVVWELAKRGKRIIAVSDTYFTAEQIGELLRIAGYPEFERIFASCEIGAGKAGGALYRRAAEALCGRADGQSRNFLAPRILHIGDNGEADGTCAETAGWDTALLMNPAKICWEDGAVTPYEGDMIASALRWRYRYDGAPETRGAAYGAGYLVAGPLAVGYCQWIREMAEKQGWERLLFSARDGWIMHRIYTTYLGEAEYFPVSRAAVQMLDVDRQILSYCDNNLPAHLGTGETVREVLEGMGLGALLAGWRAEGLEAEAPFDSRTLEQAKRLMIRDRAGIAAAFAPAKENAVRFFRARLAGVNRAVLIDTGWKGSAGAALRVFLRENGIPAVLDTALMGTSKSPEVAVREERKELFTWLYSPGHDRERMLRQFRGETHLGCSLMEMLFMTALPQLMSYAGEGFTYGEADARFREMTEALQAGTMDFARDYFETLRRIGSKAAIPAAAAWRYFEELLDEKDRILKTFGDYVYNVAPTPEKKEITFADRMRAAGWIR